MNLLITKTGQGVATIEAADPYSTLRIVRLSRDKIDGAPDEPGVYLLYGFVEVRPAAYVGMSTTSIRSRLRSHRADERRIWFGVVFAIPLDRMLCASVEAELISRIREAEVVDYVDNQATEERWRDGGDVRVASALNSIVPALEMLLGNDIFARADDEDAHLDLTRVERATPLARVYKAQAREKRARIASDPPGATHAYVGAGIRAWGRFEGDEPDRRFWVLAGSEWRRPNLDPDQASIAHQQRVASRQAPLLENGTLDASSMTFARDHMFANWSQAVGVVSGKGSYSGGYHWQRLEP